MTNTEPTVSAKPRGKIKQTLASEPWVRAMRVIIAAVSLFLLYRIALKFREGHLNAPSASPHDSSECRSGRMRSHSSVVSSG